MAQTDYGTPVSPFSGTSLNNRLKDWRDALHSSHSGTSRPSYAAAQMIWCDITTTPWVLKMYDGTNDIVMGTLDPTGDTFTPSAAPALGTNSVTTGNITDQNVTNGKMAAMAANTAKVNNTGSSASPSDLAMAASTILARLASGNIVAATVSQIKTLLALAYADISGLGTAAQATIGTSGATVGLLNTVNSHSAAQIGAVQALTSTSNSIAVNLALANNFSHTFTENTTLANPSNAVAGQSGCIFFTQHASAFKTLAFGSNYKWAGGSAQEISAVNGAKDTLYYNVRSSTEIELSFTKGNA